MVKPLSRIEPSALAPKPGYSQVMLCESGTLAFIAGQLPEDEQGQLVGEGNIQAQMAQVFKNTEIALASVGCGFEHIAKFTLYMRDLSQIAVFREVRDRYIQPGQPPACTSLEVSRFHDDRFLVVLESVARVPNSF